MIAESTNPCPLPYATKLKRDQTLVTVRNSILFCSQKLLIFFGCWEAVLASFVISSPRGQSPALSLTSCMNLYDLNSHFLTVNEDNSTYFTGLLCQVGKYNRLQHKVIFLSCLITFCRALYFPNIFTNITWLLLTTF